MFVGLLSSQVIIECATFHWSLLPGRRCTAPPIHLLTIVSHQLAGASYTTSTALRMSGAKLKDWKIVANAPGDDHLNKAVRSTSSNFSVLDVQVARLNFLMGTEPDT